MADTCKYGQPVVESRTNTPEYLAGHEAAFGPSSDEVRAPRRTSYRWNPELKRMVEIGGPEDCGPPETEGNEARLYVVSDLYMDGTRTADTGEDIGSRPKRREYMKREGVSDMRDWEGYWARKAKERSEVLTGPEAKRKRREQIGRAMYEATKRRK